MRLQRCGTTCWSSKRARVARAMEFSVSPVLSETRWRFITRCWDMPREDNVDGWGCWGKRAAESRGPGRVGDEGADSRHSGKDAADSARPVDEAESRAWNKGLAFVPRLDAPVDKRPAGCFPAIHRPN